jgi:hypothetical protein
MALRSPAVRPTLLALLLVGCGGSAVAQPDPATATSPAGSGAVSTSPGPTAAADPPPAATVPPVSFPRACADKSADVCTPTPAFVEFLCNKSHQDVALALFASGTPFTRMYLRGKMDELVWDEEVLALRFHGMPKGGIQVGSGAGSYDVLRWDGSCSLAVDADMLTKNKPGRPKTAKLKWHRLGDKTQTALIASSECQGAMSGDVSASCEKADGALVDAIVDYMRGGGSVPPPDGM